MHTQTHVHTHTHTHTQILANLQDPKTGRQLAKKQIQLSIHAHTNMRAHEQQTHVQIFANLQDPKTGRQLATKQTQLSFHTHTHTRLSINAYTHTCIHMHTHTDTHTYTHIHIHTSPCKLTRPKKRSPVSKETDTMMHPCITHPYTLQQYRHVHRLKHTHTHKSLLIYTTCR